MTCATELYVRPGFSFKSGSGLIYKNLIKLIAEMGYVEGGNKR